MLNWEHTTYNSKAAYYCNNEVCSSNMQRLHYIKLNVFSVFLSCWILTCFYIQTMLFMLMFWFVILVIDLPYNLLSVCAIFHLSPFIGDWTIHSMPLSKLNLKTLGIRDDSIYRNIDISSSILIYRVVSISSNKISSFLFIVIILIYQDNSNLSW